MALKTVIANSKTKSPSSNHLECRVCKQRFYTTGNLIDHMSTHKHFLLHCNICNKGFSDQKTLDDHYLTHKEVTNTFDCSQCDKKFLQKYQLEYHMQFHAILTPVSKTASKKKSSTSFQDSSNSDSEIAFDADTSEDYKPPTKKVKIRQGGRRGKAKNRYDTDEEISESEEFASDDSRCDNMLPKQTKSGRTIKRKKFFGSEPKTKHRRNNYQDYLDEMADDTMPDFSKTKKKQTVNKTRKKDNAKSLPTATVVNDTPVNTLIEKVKLDKIAKKIAPKSLSKKQAKNKCVKVINDKCSPENARTLIDFKKKTDSSERNKRKYVKSNGKVEAVSVKPCKISSQGGHKMQYKVQRRLINEAFLRYELKLQQSSNSDLNETLDTMEGANSSQSTHNSNLQKLPVPANSSLSSPNVNLQKSPVSAISSQSTHNSNLQKLPVAAISSQSSQNVILQKSPVPANSSQSSQNVNLLKSPVPANSSLSSQNINTQKSPVPANSSLSSQNVNLQKSPVAAMSSPSSKNVNLQKSPKADDSSQSLQNFNLLKSVGATDSSQSPQNFNLQKLPGAADSSKFSQNIHLQKSAGEDNSSQSSQNVNLQKLPGAGDSAQSPQNFNLQKTVPLAADSSQSSPNVNLPKSPEAANSSQSSQNFKLQKSRGEADSAESPLNIDLQKTQGATNSSQSSQNFNIQKSVQVADSPQSSEYDHAEKSLDTTNPSQFSQNFNLKELKIVLEKIPETIFREYAEKMNIRSSDSNVKPTTNLNKESSNLNKAHDSSSEENISYKQLSKNISSQMKVPESSPLKINRSPKKVSVNKPVSVNQKQSPNHQMKVSKPELKKSTPTTTQIAINVKNSSGIDREFLYVGPEQDYKKITSVISEMESMSGNKNTVGALPSKNLQKTRNTQNANSQSTGLLTKSPLSNDKIANISQSCEEGVLETKFVKDFVFVKVTREYMDKIQQEKSDLLIKRGSVKKSASYTTHAIEPINHSANSSQVKETLPTNMTKKVAIKLNPDGSSQSAGTAEKICTSFNNSARASGNDTSMTITAISETDNGHTPPPKKIEFDDGKSNCTNKKGKSVTTFMKEISPPKTNYFDKNNKLIIRPSSKFSPEIFKKGSNISVKSDVVSTDSQKIKKFKDSQSEPSKIRVINLDTGMEQSLEQAITEINTKSGKATERKEKEFQHAIIDRAKALCSKNNKMTVTQSSNLKQTYLSKSTNDDSKSKNSPSSKTGAALSPKVSKVKTSVETSTDLKESKRMLTKQVKFVNLPSKEESRNKLGEEIKILQGEQEAKFKPKSLQVVVRNIISDKVLQRYKEKMEEKELKKREKYELKKKLRNGGNFSSNSPDKNSSAVEEESKKIFPGKVKMHSSKSQEPRSVDENKTSRKNDNSGTNDCQLTTDVSQNTRKGNGKNLNSVTKNKASTSENSGSGDDAEKKEGKVTYAIRFTPKSQAQHEKLKSKACKSPNEEAIEKAYEISLKFQKPLSEKEYLDNLDELDSLITNFNISHKCPFLFNIIRFCRLYMDSYKVKERAISLHTKLTKDLV